MNVSEIATFTFLNVEEEPLLGRRDATIITVTAFVTLVIGVHINYRIYNKLAVKKSTSSRTSIDKLFIANNVVSLIGHPPLLIFFMVKHFLFPMKDYIGVVGCGVFLLFLDIFIRFHSLFLPLFIATLRYLFIVQNGWMKARGISIVVSRVVALQILVPVCLTLILQFPAFDVPQGPFNHCIGRFEVYFNPLHPDAISAGRRTPSITMCEEKRNWANESYGTNEFYLRLLLCAGCVVSKWIFFISAAGIPEMVLYPLTFHYIVRHTDITASANILKPEIIKKRRQQNSLNIYLTFWTWIAQFLTNMFALSIMTVVRGQSLFMHGLFAVLHLTINFNVLPVFYVVAVDDKIKAALHKRQFREAMKVFFSYNE